MAYADRCFIAVFAGIVACGFGSLAWYSAQRRVRIHRWPHWGQVLGSAACFIPMMFIFSDARMKAAIAALLVVETVGFAWFMRRNLLGGLTLMLLQALARRASLPPSRRGMTRPTPSRATCG